jgi:flagellar hook-associated protein 3 FlgL
MKTTYVSTQGMANATRRSVLEMQSELTRLQKEVTTGRAADIGLALGARTGRTVTLRMETASLQTLIDSNAIAGSRLSSTQATLGSIAADAQGFLSRLIDAKGKQSDAAVTQQRAGTELASLIAKLNSTLEGDYVFGGINSGVEPIA